MDIEPWGVVLMPKVEKKCTTTTRRAGAQPRRTRAQISGVNEEDHDDATEPLADSIITVDITADRPGPRADLLDAAFKVAMEARRGNSNTAVTFSLDYVKVEVTHALSTHKGPPPLRRWPLGSDALLERG